MIYTGKKRGPKPTRRKLTKQAYSLQARQFLTRMCEVCGVHHIDQRPRNNNPDNIQTLCKPCHDFWHSLAKRRGLKVAGRMPILLYFLDPLEGL
jgi:5-methylcytosine-specific restriction endonuclease McrA